MLKTLEKRQLRKYQHIFKSKVNWIESILKSILKILEFETTVIERGNNLEPLSL